MVKNVVAVWKRPFLLAVWHRKIDERCCQLTLKIALAIYKSGHDASCQLAQTAYLRGLRPLGQKPTFFINSLKINKYYF